MKTFLILLLSLALLAAALLTRPARREFVLYLLDRQTGPDKAWSSAAVDHAQDLTRNVTFRNRLLWTDVEKDGKVLYTGLFSHWIPRGEKAELPLPDMKELAKLVMN